MLAPTGPPPQAPAGPPPQFPRRSRHLPTRVCEFHRQCTQRSAASRSASNPTCRSNTRGLLLVAVVVLVERRFSLRAQLYAVLFLLGLLSLLFVMRRGRRLGRGRRGGLNVC